MPAMPAATNADRQPQVKASQGTIAGAMIAPTLVPELKIAVAKRSLPLREPKRDRLDRRRKIAALAQPQRAARHEEPADVADQRMRRRRHAPGGDRGRVADLGAETVDERPEQQEADRVRRLEHRVHSPELLVGPVQLLDRGSA